MMTFLSESDNNKLVPGAATADSLAGQDDLTLGHLQHTAFNFRFQKSVCLLMFDS